MVHEIIEGNDYDNNDGGVIVLEGNASTSETRSEIKESKKETEMYRIRRGVENIKNGKYYATWGENGCDERRAFEKNPGVRN